MYNQHELLRMFPDLLSLFGMLFKTMKQYYFFFTVYVFLNIRNIFFKNIDVSECYKDLPFICLH